MKTAIDWLIEQTRTPEWNSLKRGEIIEIAKEKEKQQILTANNRGYKVGRKDIAETANEYYQYTFGDSYEAGI
jgi:hypothetical protein